MPEQLFVPPETHEQIRRAIRLSGVIQFGHFIFAEGDHAYEKYEFNSLWLPENIEHCETVQAAQAEVPTDAEAVAGVPFGAVRDSEAQSPRLKLPHIKLWRPPGAGKREYDFVTEEDRDLASQIRRLRLHEDAGTSLGSAHAAAQLFHPDTQIELVVTARRRAVDPDYLKRFVQVCYMLEDEIPSWSAMVCQMCIPR